MRRFFYILLTLNIFSLIIASKPAPTETYPNEIVLIEPDAYYLYWKHDNQNIVFEIHYKSLKWALLGLGGNSYSDLIVGWVNEDGTGHFSDRKLINQNNQNILNIDQTQNWLPLDAFKKDNYTVLKFKRDIKLLCNENLSDDLDIVVGNNSLIFASGNLYNSKDDSISIDILNKKNIELLKQAPGPFDCVPLQPKLVLNTIPTEKYLNQLDLIEGIYRIYWNFSKTDIVAEVHVKTQGWVSFGFSPNGGMDKSDVFVGWISNGVANFTDRFINKRQVIIDKNQNWDLLFSRESNGITLFKFKRNIKLCDSDDRIIEDGSPYVIYAYGTNDPAPGQDIAYHLMNRGSKKVNFVSIGDVRVETDTDAEVLDFTISNVILPRADTYYYCKGFQVPRNLTQKRHIFKYEIQFPKTNYKSMHHVLVYECTKGYNGTYPEFKNGDCFTNEEKYKYCQAATFGWAVGGSEVNYFPENTGYPIGGDTDYSYFVFELHYDNPLKEIGFIEKITLRYHATKILKQQELGVLILGSDSSPYSIAIPPGIEYFPIETYCIKDCTSQKLKDFNITVVSASPHTHLTGVDVWTKIIRNGNDIGYLFRNKYYDFNYQNSYKLTPFVNITKDDELITHCGYNTVDRNTFTTGGMSTRKEMCLHFLTYFPRTKFKGCISVPYGEDYAGLLIHLNNTGAIKISDMPEGNTAKFFKAIEDAYKTIDNKPVTDEIKKNFFDFFKETRISGYCGEFHQGPFEQTKPKNKYIEKDECALPLSNQNFLTTLIEYIKKTFQQFWHFLFN